MYMFYTNDGFQITRKEDLPKVIEEVMGEDLADIVKDLIADAEETTHRLYEEIDNYAHQEDEYRSQAYEAHKYVLKLIDYIEDAKRMNKDTMIDMAHSINYLLNNIY